MSHFYSQIIATGSYLPPRIVPNSELVKLFTTTDTWIKEKIGIEERRYVDEGVGTSDLAVKASQNALKNAGLTAFDIDAIVFATSSPDYCAPGAGVLLQQKLGCHKIPAFDVRNTSPGFLFSLELADSLIKCGKYETVLVVGAEVHSTGLDFTDRGRLMSVLFGDGAGAVILQRTLSEHHIISTKLHSDGTHYNKLWCEGPSSLNHPRITQKMIEDGKIYPTIDGPFIFEQSVSHMSMACESLLAEQDLDIPDIDWVIPHQANLRIIKNLAKHMEIPMERVIHNIEKVGNTSSASIPIAMDEANSKGLLKKNNLIMLTSFGSGFSWGAALVRW